MSDVAFLASGFDGPVVLLLLLLLLLLLMLLLLLLLLALLLLALLCPALHNPQPWLLWLVPTHSSSSLLFFSWA